MFELIKKQIQSETFRLVTVALNRVVSVRINNDIDNSGKNFFDKTFLWNFYRL
jgi:hypothetical protein